MNKYRIDDAYGDVYIYSQEHNAYLFYGKKIAFTKKELKQMENEEL